jgi:hypothetical protein
MAWPGACMGHGCRRPSAASYRPACEAIELRLNVVRICMQAAGRPAAVASSSRSTASWPAQIARPPALAAELCPVSGAHCRHCSLS